MSAWTELIDREEMRKGAVALDIARAAAHGQGKGFKDFSKKLREHGS